jgi:hypothetical protein
MAVDDPGNSPRLWTPIPDPTVLTTQQLLRELAALREVFETRFTANDKATSLLAETVNRTPTIIQTEIAHVRELTEERFRSAETISQTRLAGIELQFAERDVRTSQAAIAGKEALDAALLSAKELVKQQNEANRGEAAKTEQNFTKQIDAQAARIDELKERIDRGEGSTAGARTVTGDVRASETYEQAAAIARSEATGRHIAIGVSMVSALVALIAVVLLITHGG